MRPLAGLKRPTKIIKRMTHTPMANTNAIPTVANTNAIPTMPDANVIPIMANTNVIPTPFLKFQHPFTCIVAAPTKAGKTTFVAKLVTHAKEMINPPPQRIIWCYSEWQEAYSKLPQVEFHQGLPDTSELQKDKDEAKLVILDDLMSEIVKSPKLTELFTRGCHHWSCSVIHITQDIFFDKRRTNRINSQYMVVMKNPADKLTPVNLAKQMFPGQVEGFMQAFAHATGQPHGYLLIDLDQNTPDDFRLRTNIFPDEFTGVYKLRKQ